MGVAHPALKQSTRAWHTRVSSGHVVMLLAGALGVLLTLGVLRSADRTVPVLVAGRNLASGTVVAAGDVRVARVHVPAGVRASIFGATDERELRGQVVTGAIAAGALVPRASVRQVGARSATRIMSFPIPRARAVDGKLVAGDRVDVIAVERNSARAGYVLTDAEVAAAAGHDDGPLGGSGDDVTVSLAVDPQSAPRLAAALDAGTVTLVRATGAAPLRDAVPFAPAGRG
jgi:Flp pilus assembly protein CpaB